MTKKEKKSDFDHLTSEPFNYVHMYVSTYPFNGLHGKTPSPSF